MIKKRSMFSKMVVFVLLLSLLGVLPSKVVYAATYPSVYMYEDPDFNTLVVARTMECSSDTALYFKWYRAYNNEKYSLEIFDSSNKKVATASNEPPVTSVGYITISWDTSKRSAGNYTVVMHKLFYSFFEWHETPNPSTYTITLTRPCSHEWDDGVVTKEATCLTEGEKTYTCKNCGETKTETIPLGAHKWDEGEVTKEPTCLEEGEIVYTCEVCGETKTETIDKLTPTIKLSAKSKSLKVKKTFNLTISNLAEGDSIKSVKSSNPKVVSVKRDSQNSFKYVVSAKKKGKATITVILKSGKKATCIIKVK